MKNEAGAPSVAATAVADGPITVVPEKLTLAERPPAKRYIVGIAPDAPFDNDTRGGVAFQKYGGPVTFDPKGKLENSDRTPLGMVLELTASQVEVMKHRVGNTVIRVLRGEDGHVVRCDKWPVRWRDAVGNWIANPHYDPKPGDEPIGKYLYCVPVDNVAAEQFRKTAPPCMVR